MSESLTTMTEILQIPEVQAAIRMRKANRIGAELEAKLGEIK